MTALRVIGLAVSRGQRQVLADVSLDVDAGELVCLVGPNGAGKSTLVSAIAGTGSISLRDARRRSAASFRVWRRNTIRPTVNTASPASTAQPNPSRWMARAKAPISRPSAIARTRSPYCFQVI